jgi:exodeoxyribonuclease V alpha subunit
MQPCRGKQVTEATPLTYFLKELFPTASAELLRLFEGAAENAGLLRGDFFTIRDWLEIADYGDAESLAALVLALMLALEEGSLCVEASAESIARRLTDLVGADEAMVWSGRIVEDLAGDCFPRLIGVAATDNRPVVLHTMGQRRYLYFQKYLRAELEFHSLLQQRLETRVPAAAPPNLGALLHEVLTERPLVAGGRPLQLDREQLLAVGAALLRRLAIISGGPGTGKTSIVLTLLRCLVRCGYQPERIALAAPTGRAAQRLGDALRTGLDRLTGVTGDSPDQALRRINAGTLHQLLAYRPTRNMFGRHAENPIPADVVIVDEASMIGLALMAQLLQALEPGAKLILLGDKDQLPSIDAGAVLAGLVPDGRGTAFGPALAGQLNDCFPDLTLPVAESEQPLSDCVVLLQTNHRSQQQIREAAQAINRRDVEVIERLPLLTMPADAATEGWLDRAETAGGCWLLEQTLGTAGELRGFAQSWAEQAYFRSMLDGTALAELVRGTVLPETLDGPDTHSADALPRLFALLERFRLLTLVRDGPWGAVEINRFLDQLLRPRLDPGARGGLFAGAPVLIARNDPIRQLNNGDVGMALRRRDGELRVVFPRQGGFVAFAEEALPAHELGFALTVHKSQGSEYGNVLVVLPPEGGRRLLTKELIYTAITRAKSLAVLCGTREVLRLAISRQVVREAGMLQLLT